jgi:RimJ/RimL family protein N-acetyltransferase
MSLTTVTVPVLETPRLILRGHRREDFESMVSIWQDPVVMHHFHVSGLSREDIWGRFLRSFGMWAVCGFGMWAVEDKASGAYAGIAGVFDSKRELTPPVPDAMPEAGWVFAQRFHGQGYATETMQAALQWADAALHQPAMFCILAPENAASVRVAVKCGFKPWYETTYHEHPTSVLQRPSVASL